jgi:hypothetical protein
VEEEQAPLFEGGATAEPLRHRFTISEASKATGKSTDQLRRAVKAGRIATTRDPSNGAYLMTAEALLAAGIDLRPQAPATPPSSDLVAKLEAAEKRIAELERDRATFEALVGDLRELIRDLPRAIGQAAPPERGEPLANPPRRRWWRK